MKSPRRSRKIKNF